MAGKSLSYSDIRHVAKFYNANKGNMTTAATDAGMPRSQFRDRVAVGRNRYPKLFGSFDPPRRGAEPKPAAEPRTLDQDIRLHRAEQAARESDARYKDALRQLSLMEDRLKDLEWANNVSFKPADWTYMERVDRKREHIPELFTSDFQAGEVVRETETEAGYGYSPELFRQRYRRMIDTTDYLAHHHGGNGWDYPGIIYLRGGDTIDGNIHPEDGGNGTLTNVETTELVFEEEAAGIEKLAESFGKVEVKTPGAAGNHDRDVKKPVSKKAFAHSFDRLIHKMLVNHFRKDKRVTFQTSESFDIRYQIYEQNILLTHGDRMGAGGGTGFIGPAATILKGWQKVVQEQAALGYRVDQMRNGHFHYPFWMPFGISNGCLPGYSEFAKTFRMRPTPPVQMLSFHHRKRGMVDLKPLVLVG